MKSTPSLDVLSSRSQPPDKPVRRIPSWSIPAGILLAFAVLFFALFGDRLLPAPEVKVATVLAAPTEQASSSGGTKPASSSDESSTLFQASGWIEPAPLPIKATALVDGVVEKVNVLPGQVIKTGDVLATLIADDAKLALASAEQRHRSLVSTATAHQAAIIGAQKKAVGLQAQVTAAATLRDESADRVRRLGLLPEGAVSQSDVVATQYRRDREESLHLAAVSSVEEAQAEVERLTAESQMRKDDIETSLLEIEKAKLALSRTTITSPIDGRVLRLLAAPGQKKMLQDQDPESSSVAILYRPNEIQVRVDVPLADALGLQIGQSVRIRCSLIPEKTFNGKVTLIAGEADLQRNTLQAKVSIDDPVDELRPEMLCRVEFLDAGRDTLAAPSHAAGSLATWIPESSLSEGVVWICDSESNRVTKQKVTPTSETKEGFVRIDGGLRPGQWVVLSPNNLRDGKRVTPNLVQQ